MPTSPWFADEDLDPLAEHDVGNGVDPAAHPGQQVAVDGRPGRGDAGRRVVVAEHVSQVAAHSPVVAPAFAASIVAGIMLRLSSRAASASCSSTRSTAAWSRSARQRSSASMRSRSTSGREGEDAVVRAGGEGRVLGLGEAVLADQLELARLDAPRSRCDRPERLARTAPLRPRRHGARPPSSSEAPLASLSVSSSITFEPSKMSG